MVVAKQPHFARSLHTHLGLMDGEGYNRLINFLLNLKKSRNIFESQRCWDGYIRQVCEEVNGVKQTSSQLGMKLFSQMKILSFLGLDSYLWYLWRKHQPQTQCSSWGISNRKQTICSDYKTIQQDWKRYFCGGKMMLSGNRHHVRCPLHR